MSSYEMCFLLGVVGGYALRWGWVKFVITPFEAWLSKNKVKE